MKVSTYLQYPARSQQLSERLFTGISMGFTGITLAASGALMLLSHYHVTPQFGMSTHATAVLYAYGSGGVGLLLIGSVASGILIGKRANDKRYVREWIAALTGDKNLEPDDDNVEITLKPSEAAYKLAAENNALFCKCVRVLGKSTDQKFQTLLSAITKRN